MVRVAVKGAGEDEAGDAGRRVYITDIEPYEAEGWDRGWFGWPEPTLNRRSMGHTLEENGKWGSWRVAGQGWDTSAQSLSFFRSRSPSLSRLGLIPRSLLPRTRCSPAASSSSLFHLPTLLLILLHYPPPSSDILFRSLTLLSPRASRLTPPSRR